MRKRLLAIAAGIAVLASVAPALAEEHSEEVTGREYGQHVAEHARAGMLGQEHNPGEHQGFSGFEEHHEEHH